MKHLALGLAVALFTAWTPPCTAQAPAPPAPYQDLIVGFQFQPPPGWQVVEAQGKLGQVSLVNKSERSFILVTVEPDARQVDTGKPPSPTQLAQLGKLFGKRLSGGGLGRSYKEFILSGTEASRIGSFNSAQLLFQAIPRAGGTEGRVVIATGGSLGRAVTILMVLPEPALLKLRPAFDLVTRSFKLG